MPSENGESDFINKVTLVCDYLVASGSPHASQLEAALKKCENSPTDTKLRGELRRVVSEVFPTIERRTLAAVLSGKFALGKRERLNWKQKWFSPTNVMAALGVLLIAGSLHWTYWSTRASAIIVSLDRVIEMQRSLNIQEIIQARDLCGYERVQLDDQDFYRFVSTAEDIKYNDTIWTGSRDRGLYLIQDFNPFNDTWRNIKNISSLFATKESKSAEFQKPSMRAEAISNTDAVCKLINTSEERSLYANYLIYQASISDLADTMPLQNGSQLLGGELVANSEYLKRTLTEYQIIVHRWFLPTIHGSFGAVLFCLVRAIREPFLVPFNSRDVTMRLFFGAFMGYLVSALFLPSGLLGKVNSNAAPIASIASFVFGYSIDAFISLLNRLNGFVADFPDKKTPKGT